MHLHELLFYTQIVDTYKSYQVFGIVVKEFSLGVDIDNNPLNSYSEIFYYFFILFSFITVSLGASVVFQEECSARRLGKETLIPPDPELERTLIRIRRATQLQDSMENDQNPKN